MNQHSKTAVTSAILLFSAAAPLYAYAGFWDRRLDFEYSTEALLAVYCCALAAVIPLSVLFFRSGRSARVKESCRRLAGAWYCPLVLWLLLPLVVLPWLNLADMLLWFAAFPVFIVNYAACMVYVFVFKGLRKAWLHLYVMFTLAAGQLAGYAAYACVCRMHFFQELFRYPSGADGVFVYPVDMERLVDDARVYLACLVLAALPVAVLYAWRGVRAVRSKKNVAGRR